MNSTDKELESVLLDVIDREYGHVKSGAKKLAGDSGTSVNAANNWLRRLNAPNGTSLVNLMVANDAVYTAYWRFVATQRAQQKAKVSADGFQQSEAVERRHFLPDTNFPPGANRQEGFFWSGDTYICTCKHCGNSAGKFFAATYVTDTRCMSCWQQANP